MAFLGSEKLKILNAAKPIIVPWKDENVKCGSYELSLGGEAFSTDSRRKKRTFLKKKTDTVKINPGQFALLLTEETVSIPDNKIAFISIRAGIKLMGLVNVSGFHVDPGFTGQLVFSVYNAGAGPIILDKAQPCFLIWFADLSESETIDYDKGKHDHKNQHGIPTKYVQALSAGELASPSALLEKIDRLKRKVNAVGWLVRFTLIVLLTLGLGALGKYIIEPIAYNKGLEAGYSKNKEMETQTTESKLLEEKIMKLEAKLDSLLLQRNESTERSGK